MPSAAKNCMPKRSTPWGRAGGISAIRSNARLANFAVSRFTAQPGTASLLTKRSSFRIGYFLSRWAHHAPIPAPAASAAQAFFLTGIRPILDISSVP